MPLNPYGNPVNLAGGPYPGPGLANLLKSNEQQYLFTAATVPPNQVAAANGSNASASIAVQLERIKSAFYPFGVSFEIGFSASPGVFEVDVQTADQDKDSSFVTISSLTGGLNASNVGRVELPTFWAKYVRVYVKTLPNPVTITALVTR
jgi:hypothetical protein